RRSTGREQPTRSSCWATPIATSPRWSVPSGTRSRRNRLSQGRSRSTSGRVSSRWRSAHARSSSRFSGRHVTPLCSTSPHDGQGEPRMNKPRIFLGSSGKQAELLAAITDGLEDIADVEPWTTAFNPGRSTLDRLVELSQEVDFAAFVFAQDDW